MQNFKLTHLGGYIDITSGYRMPFQPYRKPETINEIMADFLHSIKFLQTMTHFYLLHIFTMISIYIFIRHR